MEELEAEPRGRGMEERRVDRSGVPLMSDASKCSRHSNMLTRALRSSPLPSSPPQNPPQAPFDPFTATANSPAKPKRDPTKSPRKNRWLKMSGTMGSTMGSTMGAGGETEEPTSILRYYAKWVDDIIDVEDISEGDPKTPRVPETIVDKREELYKIHFYLEDGSLEILVSNKKDLKYKMYPTLLSRQMATKAPMVSVNDIGTDKEYLTFEDFRVGQEVIIQNRRMLIYQCDERTYKWIEQQTGVDMRGDEVDITEKEVEVERAEIEVEQAR
jgi:hypothetical protein